jgi:hypothetical protein
MLTISQAKEEARNFAKVGKEAIYENLRQVKTQLKKEKTEKREMKVGTFPRNSFHNITLHNQFPPIFVF